MNLKRLAFSILISVALALQIYPASADIREATYEVQGVCFDRIDRVFDDALEIRVNAGAVTNARPHMHVPWLIQDGVIRDRAELLGTCAIVFSQWVRGADGNMHQMAYVPKGHPGIEFVPGAYPPSPEEAIDNYFHGSDFETGAAMGCIDVGSTKGGRGNSGGDCK